MKDGIAMHQGERNVISGSQNQETLFLNNSNIVNLCIDSYNEEQQEGRLYHQYTKNPLSFFSLITVLEQMELLYDEIRFPFASTKTRSFFVDRRGRKRNKSERAGNRQDPEHPKESARQPIVTEYKRREMKRMETLENVIKHRGTDATFIIRVSHRQNSSWQGEVTWVDQKKKEYFRSALELIKMIDGALNGPDSATNGSDSTAGGYDGENYE